MTRAIVRRGSTLGIFLLVAPRLAGAASEDVRSLEIVESSAFLEGYRVASEAQSADFYDFYSDRAVIHVRIQDQAQGIAFSGRAFKAWGRELLKAGRPTPDGSIFRDPTVEQRGSRLVIRAKRYSTLKCYWDLGYQVGIEREGSAYRIVDERLSTQPEAHCESARTAAQVSSKPARFSLQEYGTLAPSSGAHALEPADAAPWRPLSQQELADKALKLAQQMAAARASQSSAGAASLPAAGALPLSGAALRNGTSSAPTPRSSSSSDLRVTPEE